VCGLLILNGVALYLFIVDTHIEQTIGVLLAALGAVGLMAALEGYRRGHVVGLAHDMGPDPVRSSLWACTRCARDRLDVPATYFGLAAIALAGPAARSAGGHERDRLLRIRLRGGQRRGRHLAQSEVAQDAQHDVRECDGGEASSQ
jgi:hypothetical protein